MSELPDWAQSLGLTRHPEGGWYRETWRSDVTVPPSVLPHGYRAARSAATAILFLLPGGEQSAWHTVRGTEIWLHHRGSAVLLELGGDADSPGAVTSLILGPDTAAGQLPQQLVPPSTWQRARPLTDEASLVSCIVTPGFDFDDFRLDDASPGSAGFGTDG